MFFFQGVDVNAKDKSSMTAVFYAATNSLRVVELLVANGNSTRPPRVCPNRAGPLADTTTGVHDCDRRAAEPEGQGQQFGFAQRLLLGQDRHRQVPRL
jgi:hypothetical protein